MILDDRIKALLLRFLDEKTIVMSWGISDIEILQKEVCFTVNGFKYKGIIEISVNQSVYNVKYLQNTIECTLDNLIADLDMIIEKGEMYYRQIDKWVKQNLKCPNEMMPSEPVHPGLLLKEEIEYRGLTQKQLAQQMGVSYSVLNEILNGKRPISIEYALYLEAVLGIDAQLWIQMQADYNLQVAKSDRKINRHLLEIRKIAAAF